MEHKTEWEKICESVYDEVSRCLIHIEHGMFTANRDEPLHATLLQMLPKEVTQTKTTTIGLSISQSKICILIHPDFFLHTLKSTEERSAVLRHVEQHIFLQHPERLRRLYVQCQDENRSFDPLLFQFSAEVETNEFISGYAPIQGNITSSSCKTSLPTLQLPKMASAEYIYQEIQNQMTNTGTTTQTLLSPILQKCPCDHSHWEQVMSINIFSWEIIANEFDRLLIRARENLSVDQVQALSQPLQKSLGERYAKHDLFISDPALAGQTQQEIESIIIKMLMADPFFGHFLSACIIKITDTIDTAGVALMKDHIALLVNPTFFMKNLKNKAERGGVLKHEALHIMLKHIIQMRNSKFSNKMLYDIAADLEVNQYIGAPWSLPKGAILLSSFPHLQLPANDVAETYYNILLKEVENNTKTGKQLKEMGDAPSTGGHSNHGNWGDQANGQEGSPQQKPGKKGLQQGMQAATDMEAEIQDINIEKQMQDAKDSLSSKQAGSIPGRFLQLLNEWVKAREPSIDWKRELRLFVSTNPSSTIKKTHRKKNKRYFRFVRESLKVQSISTDALRFIARARPEKIPEVLWQDVSGTLQQEILSQHPYARTTNTIPLQQISAFLLWKTMQETLDKPWPVWDDLTDTELHRLQLLRTPLDPTAIPADLYIVIAKNYVSLLPPISWQDFTPSKKKELCKKYVFLDNTEVLTWGVLPSEVIIWLHQHKKELFTLTWQDVPPQMLINLPFYQLVGKQPFRIDRKLSRNQPGISKKKNFPKILIIIDTSGSVGDIDIEYLFAEVDGIHKLGTEVYVLEADTSPQLFFRYEGQKPMSGRGGTDFDKPLEWMNDARHGTPTPVIENNEKTMVETIISFDGVIYLTDGYASTPTVKPYCRMLWVITPDGSDDALKEYPHASGVLRLPPYDKR